MTLSEEVAAALWVRASAHSEDIGALADRILRAALQPGAERPERLDQPVALRIPHPITACLRDGPPSRRHAAREADPAPSLEERFFDAVMECIGQTIGLVEFTRILAYDHVAQGPDGRPIDPDVEATTRDIDRWIKDRRIPKEWQFEVYTELSIESKVLSDFFGEANISPAEFFFGAAM